MKKLGCALKLMAKDAWSFIKGVLPYILVPVGVYGCIGFIVWSANTIFPNDDMKAFLFTIGGCALPGVGFLIWIWALDAMERCSNEK